MAALQRARYLRRPPSSGELVALKVLAAGSLLEDGNVVILELDAPGKLCHNLKLS